MAEIFEKITIIGFGHIGSSIARAVQRKGLAKNIIACDTSKEHRDLIEINGLANAITDDFAQAVHGADLILLSTPISSYKDICHEIAPHLKKGAIISDVGSVKTEVAKIFQEAFHEKSIHIIPAHPVAGIEKSGPMVGMADMFDDRYVIFTPAHDIAANALEALTKFWQGMGSQVELMTPEHHDRVLAITSHLPHLIAYAIVGTASDLETAMALENKDKGDLIYSDEVIKFSAGGFRDFTRIAASNPIMWRDIFLNNREAVLEMIGRFQEDLFKLQRAIRWEDGAALEDSFIRSREIRKDVVAQKQAGQFKPQE